MIRRVSLIAIELVAGLLGVAAIAVALLFWRLTSEPISLAFASPYIERALSVEKSSIDVRIEDTELIWAGWDRAFNIRVTNAAILGPGGKVLALLPEVSIGISIAALTRGVIAPKRLDIHGLSASVERDETGAIALGFFAGKDEAADREFVRQIPGYLAQLTDPNEASPAFGYLRSVRITDVNLRFVDRPRNATWQAPDTDIELLRDGDDLEVIAAMALAFDERTTHLTAHVLFGPERPTIDLDLAFRNLVPADFARRIPELSQVAALELPLSGRFRALARQDGAVKSVAFELTSEAGKVAGNAIAGDSGDYELTAKLTDVKPQAIAAGFPGLERHARIDTTVDATITGRFGAEGSLQRLDIGATAGAGTIDLKERLKEPVTFRKLRLVAQIEDNFALARIAEAELDLGGPKVLVEATAHRLGDNYQARVDARLRDLPMSELDRYWPRDLGVPARTWTTTNIRVGVVEEGTLGLVFQIPSQSPMDFITVSVSGGLKYRDLAVSYFGDLPTVVGVRGTASFTHDRFNLDLTRGRLRDVQVEHGAISMTRLDTDDEAISIDLVLRGPLRTALAVANSRPLGFVSGLGIDPTKVGGAMALRLGFRFPLRSDVRTDQVDVVASANLRGVRMEPGPFGFDLDQGNLELKLASRVMKVGGNVHLNGVPLALDWHEEFNPKTPFRSRYILSGRLTPGAMSRLGVKQAGFLNGPSQADLIYTRFEAGNGELLVGVDLKEAVVALPQLGWRKPAGQPGTLSLDILVDPAGHPTVERLLARAEGLDIDARIDFEEKNLDSWRMEFQKLVLGTSDLKGHLRRVGDGYALALEGSRLDLEPLKTGGVREAREISDSADTRLPAIELDARVKELRLGPDGLLRDVDVRARYDGRDWRALRLNAAIGGGKTFRVGYLPDDGGGTRLEVSSDDAGAVLRLLGWSERLEGGLLTVSGHRASTEAPLSGAFKLSDYKLTQAPILARLLQVASLTGIFDALGQRGLDFVSFDGAFTYRDGRLAIDRARTFGSSLGITVEGTLDIEEDTADLAGTVVPAYTVNRVLGQIPLLGRLLTGGENEGVFAASYAVTGPIEDPVVAVNPLSALAPGFLRKLFDLIGRGDGDKPLAPTERPVPRE